MANCWEDHRGNGGHDGLPCPVVGAQARQQTLRGGSQLLAHRPPRGPCAVWLWLCYRASNNSPTMHKVRTNVSPATASWAKGSRLPSSPNIVAAYCYAISHHPDQGWWLIEARKG